MIHGVMITISSSNSI